MNMKNSNNNFLMQNFANVVNMKIVQHNLANVDVMIQ